MKTKAFTLVQTIVNFVEPINGEPLSNDYISHLLQEQNKLAEPSCIGYFQIIYTSTAVAEKAENFLASHRFQSVRSLETKLRCAYIVKSYE